MVQQIQRPIQMLNLVYFSMSTKIILQNGQMVRLEMECGLRVIVIGNMILLRLKSEPISGHALSA